MSGTKVRCKFPTSRKDSRSFPPPDAIPVVVEPGQPKGPSRAARTLALAHHIESLIEAGELRDYAAAARALGLTRARMTQVMNLLLLAPEVQERVLSGLLPIPAGQLRTSASEPEWTRQMATGPSPKVRRAPTEPSWQGDR